MDALSVSFRSAHGPPFSWSLEDKSAPASSSGIGAWFLAWLRPELRIVTPFGNVTQAPGGPAPASSSWPLVPLVAAGVLVLLVVLAVVGVVSLLRR